VKWNLQRGIFIFPRPPSFLDILFYFPKVVKKNRKDMENKEEEV